MDCPFCKDDVKAFNSPRKAHLLIHKDAQDHIHTHGDLDKKEDIKDMLETALTEIGIDIPKPVVSHMPDEIVFHNRQRIGDILMFTCAVRDFKVAYPNVRVNVISTAGHIWDHNPHIDRNLIATDENTIKIGPGKLTNSSNRLDWHFANAYRVSIEDALKVNIPQGESRPDIWLTEEEYNAPRFINKPYWIICVSGEKGWGCKMYPFVKWQEFVSLNPDITFVQIGAQEDNPPRLQGENVIDHVGKTQSKETGIRDLYKLFLNTEGSIGLVSFHMHLSGALYKPAIIVAGAREPVAFTRYQGHAYLATDGMLPCAATTACWHCGIETCTNPVTKKNQNGNDEIVPKCVDMIEPEDITKALQGFYTGGRLNKTTPSTKPKLKNVVKTPKNPILDPQAAIIKSVGEINTYGLKWCGAAIMQEDWAFIQQVLKKMNIKSVVEFGAGLSTLLFNDNVKKVVTYEDCKRWKERTLELKPSCEIRLWDRFNIEPTNERFDLAFVDGPSGGATRGPATDIASKLSDIVIVHDGYGVDEQRWQEMYLKAKGYHGTFRGGRRCYLWAKDASIYNDLKNMGKVSITKPIVKPNQNLQGKVTNSKSTSKQHVKIVSTARGWGGCARSITTIMKLLLKEGHKVEFIPFRNAVTSGEMKAMLNNELSDVIVTENYDTLKEHCDVLLMYADDYVWEFTKPEVIDIFSHIGAERKIMMLNYRRGKVGELQWTQGWDKYMFLNSSQERELLAVYPTAKTRVLAPCTDLTPFFEVTPDYNHNLRIVRHSSQGDTKFDKDNTNKEITDALFLSEDSTIHMLPGPSFVQETERFKRVKRTADPKVIAEFLSKGNLFWYSLPKGYMDQGPRVILEAMACGLPVLADNWGGVADRVNKETGWLCDNKEQHLQIIQNVASKELKEKGEKARERAFNLFRVERWLDEVLK